MVTQLQNAEKTEIIYPEDDGKPMSDNTKQYLWLVLIKEALEWLFQSSPDVFVAGNLLWYPVEGNIKIRNAPDVMVIFGRPKGHRGSYQQWKEDNITPQVVFEVRSPGNSQTELDEKLVFYDCHGVEEYYLYDPQKNDLSGWLRSGTRTEGNWRLQVINPIEGWVSPRLGIRLELSQTELEIYRPDGERFATYVEMAQRAEQERQRAEQERQRASQAESLLEQAESLLEQERQRAERLAERLRAAGIDPDVEI